MQSMSFEQALERIFSQSSTTKQQGDAFERATVYFLKNDPLWSGRLDGVWLWAEAPTKTGQDIGIDIVARDADDGGYWAVQCKCYAQDETLTYQDVATFFSTASADGRYSHYLVVDTANAWTSNLEKVAKQYSAVRLNAQAMSDADLNWAPFFEGRSAEERSFQELRPHQREAVDACLEGFRTNDRGKLIMACGTGKTLTALRLAEELCPSGSVLFLAPSISLVSQTLRAWANQAKVPLRAFVVCSDAKASKVRDAWETSVIDVPWPATTDPARLASQVSAPVRGSARAPLTVVFSTYQSIQVVIDAQGLGLPAFDLCVCDEAHRTTGVAELGCSPEERSAFIKVHDAGALKAGKRLYMTATPRVYSESAKRRAHEDSFELSSMDDEAKYGPEFYRLGFGRAVELGLLSDYRVIVLAVSEQMASGVYQRAMDGEAEGFKVPDAAKVLGCWKALATRGERGRDLQVAVAGMDDDGSRAESVAKGGPKPMRRALAFSNTIAESREFAAQFQTVVDAYVEGSGMSWPLRVEVDHVDGGMNAVERRRKLDWLDGAGADDAGAAADDDAAAGENSAVCRVLSNAKCLAEGVDVPALDAVIFMKPRNSQVEIVQSVGRVMRKAEGKDYGYIILPVVVPAGMTPEQALDDNEAFRVVWQVLQALRSHDERLDARINSFVLGEERQSLGDSLIVDLFDEGRDGQEEQDAARPVQEQLDLRWTVEEWQDAMEAKLVKRCGTRVYWEDWADDVAGIAKRHIARIHAILDSDAGARKAFEGFLEGLRDSLNPGVDEDDAVEMLAQHLITKPIFEALFDDASFVDQNPVSRAMEGMLDVLRSHAIEDREDDARLEGLYASVRTRAAQVTDPAGRQALIKELYGGFFSRAFADTADKMGIVYTPNEVVDYILSATDAKLKEEFGCGIGERGVHVLDPFAGTGTFMAQLIEGPYISDADLPGKYGHELHSNEIMLLAYYIMTVNIEQAYHARMGGEYRPFAGAVLTDTFQMTEEGDTIDVEVFSQNTERVLDQNDLPITAIVGNPPYSVGQKSSNDNNQNEAYPTLDRRIADTYAARTDATNKNSLYDSYIRAFRWASDRIGDAGVVCFVSNAGWIRGAAMDGMRKCLAEEFSEVRVFDLRGNQRTQGEESRREGGKIFGSGSRAPIAVTMLVRNPAKAGQGCRILYHNVGDYLTREEKLAALHEAVEHPEGVAWEEIVPDAHGDWLDQRDDSFYEFAPMGLEPKFKEPEGLFATWSRGVATCRDPWAWNYSRSAVAANMSRLVDNTNAEAEAARAEGRGLEYDARRFSWTRAMKGMAERGAVLDYDGARVVPGMYRPFCRQWIYYDRRLNEMVYQQPKLFPPALAADGAPGANMAVCFSVTNRHGFSCIVTDVLPDLHMDPDGAQCFPLYWYEEAEADEGALPGLGGGSGLVRHDAITDEALATFRAAYPRAFAGRAPVEGGEELTKLDLFHYVYGVLHSPEYRSRFAANLKKELPRIPLCRDFRAFSEAGCALADLHLNYEQAEPWPSIEEQGDPADPGRTEKIAFGKCKKDDAHPKGEDRTALHVAERMTLTGIPERAYDYMVNGKSAIGWVMDRYQVRTDKATGIVNDPNLWSDDPRYIVELVEKVVTVSMETLDIVEGLPPLHEREQPAEWPQAWKLS